MLLRRLFILNSGVVVYFLDQRITRIGRKDATEHDQHICLSGLSIASEHAQVTYDAESKAADAVTIMPIGKNAKVTVNGKKVVVSKYKAKEQMIVEI